MGASWSSDHPADLEQHPDPPSQSKYPRYGDVVPSVCSDRPEDLYDELYEQIYFVQHANQDCIVAFQRCEKDNPRVDPEEWFTIAERIPRVYEHLAHRTNVPNVDIDQPIDLHPYIVNSSTVWIRDDLSIALSGFVNATIPTDEWPYSPDGTRYEEEIYYPTNPESGHPELSPKIDLSDWATFVWQLMRKDASSHRAKRWAMPTNPLDPTELPGEVNVWEYHKQRLKEGKLQLLEEARLGPMLVKAWKGQYENAQEILQEIRLYLQQIGVQIDGEDEVLLEDGRKWEDVFTVVQTDGARWGREIRYK
ncbi:hypothetical protein BDV32DRAFT_160763 [Aspergillus pseudonomiae]|nr:hypothetical protein BDV32DRAFT_160763 [Aspergillus pseudonomiae]